MVMQDSRLAMRYEIQNMRDDKWIHSPQRDYVEPNWSSKGDPYHEGLCRTWRNIISRAGGGQWNFERIYWFADNTYPIHIKYDGKYYLNGRQFGLKIACNIFARVTYACFFEEQRDYDNLMKVYLKAVSVPEPILYVLENRVPYYFYADYQRQDVRLNVEKIGRGKYAIELSDSVWGEISESELVTFVNSFRNNNKRGKWYRMSPALLYKNLVGKDPSESELKIMIAFLSQNRTKDIVEKRAKELILETCELMPTKFFYHVEHVEEDASHKKIKIDGYKLMKIDKTNNEWLFVRGQLYDWKIQKVSNRESRQSVNTYVYNIQHIKEKTGQIKNEDGDWIDTFETKKVPMWLGPICVDNLAMGGAQSIGDQMVARGYAFLNDRVATKLISTINAYLYEEDMSNHRLDFEYLLNNNIGELICRAKNVD
mgnify:CR=1 FL=1